MMPGVEPVAQRDRLRIAVLADFDGPHAASWLRWFVARGHDVHAVSFYPPRQPLPGTRVHVLHAASAPPSASSATDVPARRGWRDRVPGGALRLLHAARYYRAGLARVLNRIDPDILHAHFVVEHGFYGTLARRHPYVVTAWGSDVLVEPQRDLISRWIARWTVRRADLVTSNNAYMAQRVGALGALPSKVAVITLGAERFDLELADRSVNRADASTEAPVIISTRAHEPLYNIPAIIDAYRLLVRTLPTARLVIANNGSLTHTLRASAAGLPGVTFTGVLDRSAFRGALADAAVFVSTPSSDATSVALMQAMAAGAFPIVSDLPSQQELIRDGVNGLLVPPGDPAALCRALIRALDDGLLRRTAAESNRRLVEERGLNEVQMAVLEGRFYALAGRTSPALSAIA